MTFIMSFIDCFTTSSRMCLLLVTVGGWLTANWNKDKSKLRGLHGRDLAILRMTFIFLYEIPPAECN